MLPTLLLLLVSYAKCELLDEYDLVDLTYEQDSEAKGWPTFEKFEWNLLFAEEKGVPGQWASAGEFTQAEHLGTHIDAPIHFIKGGKTIEEIPLQKLIGPGVVIDVADVSNHGDSNYQVSLSDLQHWERDNGRIPENAIVLIYTGNSKYYGDEAKYYGWNYKKHAISRAINKMHYPGLSESAAKWLVSDRQINGVGIDTVSLDSGESGVTLDMAAHRTLLGADIWIAENVNEKLGELPKTGFYVMALPYKIKSATGSPTRMVAILGMEAEAGVGLVGSAVNLKPATMIMIMYLMVFKKWLC